MVDQIEMWGRAMAAIRANYVPPCRPSWSEIVTYTKYLREIQHQLPGRKAKLLILGSTSEFRDWGHEENLDVTVVDFSTGYNEAMVEQMRYKQVHERFVNQSWLDMTFADEFDLIIGEIIIGNLKKAEIPAFLTNIARALTDNGLFMTKSFFRDKQYPIHSLPAIFQQYLENHVVTHPFSTLIYDIALSCMDKETDILNCNQTYDAIHDLYKANVINAEIFSVFENLGWQSSMTVQFYIPTITEWEKMASAHFKIHAIDYGSDVYSKNFPLYFLSK